nr:PD-(D/E)XK motif protein [Stenotrophomonas koreensis]
MARSNQEQLESAWRALAGMEGDQGWRVIDVARSKNGVIQAGRCFPGREESLLIGTRGLRVGSDTNLPRGQGFSVAYIDPVDSAGDWTWFALSRTSAGQPALFALMAEDLLALFAQAGGYDGERIRVAMLGRIRAWQDFMKRDRLGVLSPEAELGLFGELVVLRDIVCSGVPAADAVRYWAGPEEGLQDYLIGTGAVEVKSTVSPAGFIAEIGSLEQLDDSLRQPLYVAAVRFSLSPDGLTLPEICAELEAVFVEEAGSPLILKDKLISAGYVDLMAEKYSRRFLLQHIGYRLIRPDSPRLTRGNVPAPVQRARYSLDLEVIPVVASEFGAIFKSFGDVTTWS